MKISNLLLITVLFILISCDKGDPEPFRPTEKIVNLAIVSPEIDEINFGDPVNILAKIEINIDPIEPARITFYPEKGDVLYNNEIVNHGDVLDLNTSEDIIFTYIPKRAEDPSMEAQKHFLEVMTIGCDRPGKVTPNCSAGIIRINVSE